MTQIGAGVNGRNETDAERADRNWLELIQELRVAQTGIQVLAGFLLTLPFSSRFGEIVTCTAPSTSSRSASPW